MPSFAICTNVSKDAIPDGFLKRVTNVMAAETGKPDKFITVRIDPDKLMSFGGTDEPCATCDFHCIGKISKEENAAHSAALFEIINEELKIPIDRMYINFWDLNRENVGWNGKTFATL